MDREMEFMLQDFIRKGRAVIFASALDLNFEQGMADDE